MPNIHMTRLLLVVAPIAIALAGCAGPESTARAIPSTTAVSASGSASVTSIPPEAVSPPATSTPLVWTELEQTILDGLREDAASGCVPRREDLPSKTIAAVECRPKAASVSRVGFYFFEDWDQASAAYLNRIRDEGLSLDESVRASRYERPMWACADEEDHVSFQPDPCEQFREAGFINASGYANYRAVFDRLYIGILGRNDDVEALRDWAWSSEHWRPEPPAGEMGEVPEVPTVYEGEMARPFPPD